MIKVSVATPKTDAALRKRYRQQGAIARAAGIPRDDCPIDGLIAKWWLEGWDENDPRPTVREAWAMALNDAGDDK